MKDWASYYLSDIPFVEYPSISVGSRDDRINGKIFSFSGMEPAYKKILSLIRREKGICYIRSDSEVLGTGKSALMAAIYWHCQTDNTVRKSVLPIWMDVRDFRSITQLFGRILDSLVFERVIDLIKTKVKNLEYSSIDRFLSTEKRQRSPSVIYALSKILSMSREEMPWKYVNIRRSISTVSAVEIFEYIMLLFRKCDSRRVVIFIDQFEEYVKTQRGTARIRQLGEDINDMFRMIQECQNLSFILTLHPTAQRQLEMTAGPTIDTFGTIMENSATINPLEPKHLVKMAQTYLEYFRISNAPEDIKPTYPFEEDAIVYLAKRSGGFPRIFIRFLHNALYEAALAGQDVVTSEFIKKPENLVRIGILESPAVGLRSA